MIHRARITAIHLLLLLAIPLVLRATAAPAVADSARVDGVEAIAGQGASGLQIVNLDASAEADVAIDFYRQGGGAPVTVLREGLPAGGLASVYLPAESALSGGAYSAIVRSDQAIDVLARHDWAATGAGVVEDSVGVGTDLILPYAVKNFVGSTSLISVQNTDFQAVAHGTLTFHMGGTEGPPVERSLSLAPGSSMTISLAEDAELAGIPDSTSGWMQLTSDRPMALSSIVDLAGSPQAAYGVEGGPLARLGGTRLAAPFVANAYATGTGGSHTTGVTLLNPGDAPVSALLRYVGSGGSCGGLTLLHGPFTIPAKGSQVFFQGNIDSLPTGDSGLPVGCSASAVVEADGPVVATVNSTHPAGSASAAAPARPVDQAARRLALPIVRRRHTQLALSSLIAAYNPGPQAAQVALQVSAASGQALPCQPDCLRTIPAGGATLWDLGAIAALTDNSYGSAWIESDQPLLSAVLETGSIDATLYNGLPAPEGAVDGAARTRAVPLLLRGIAHAQPQATRVPRPTAIPGEPTVTPEARPLPTGSLRDDAATTGIQVLNLGSAAATASLDLQSLRGGAPVQVSVPAVPVFAAANFYLPSDAALHSENYAGVASLAGQPMDALFRSDWHAKGKSVLGRAPNADLDLVLPMLACHEGVTNGYLAVQNSDAAMAASVVLELHAFEGQRQGLRRLSLSLAGGAGTLIDLCRHSALQDLVAGAADWSGWARLSSDRPIAALALVDLEQSDGAYLVQGLTANDQASLLAVPMLFRQWRQNAGAGQDGVLDSSIHVVNPNAQPVTVALRYRVADGPSPACAAQTILHGGGTRTLAPGAVGVFHQQLPAGGDSGLPPGCAASALIEASAPVAAVVDIATAHGLVAAYPAEPVDLARDVLHLTLARREHTSLLLSSFIQVQNPGSKPVTATLRVFLPDESEIACPDACRVSLAPGAAHLWDPRQIDAWPAGTYGAARIEADGPVTAIVLDASTRQGFDLAAYAALRDSGRRTAPLPLLHRMAALGLQPEPELEPFEAPQLGITRRPPTAEGDRLTTRVGLESGSQGLRRAVLHFVYDASWLRFDGADGDGDGLPDAVVAALPAGAGLRVANTSEGREGRLTLTVSAAQEEALRGAFRFEITLRQTAEPGADAFGLAFDPKGAAELTGADGLPLLPDIAGNGWRPGGYHEIYLPGLAIAGSSGRR